MSESLFLEDLKLKHFELLNLRQQPLTFKHMSLVMKALGKFHAISFALKDQQRDKFKQLSSLVYDQYWTNFKDDFQAIYEFTFNYFKTCMEKLKRFDLLEKLNKAAGENPCGTALKMATGPLAEPYAVICHGDVTTNNSMFRTNEQGNPIDFKLFDWQFSRYASPVTELVPYLMCSTTKELRAKHYDDFLKIYHESLSDLLMRLDFSSFRFYSFLSAN